MCQKPCFNVDDVLKVGWGARRPLRKLEPGGDDDLARLNTLFPKVTDTLGLYPELTCNFPRMTWETLQDRYLFVAECGQYGVRNVQQGTTPTTT